MILGVVDQIILLAVGGVLICIVVACQALGRACRRAWRGLRGPRPG